MLRNSLLATSLLAVCACGPTSPSATDILPTSGGTSSGGSAATTGGTGATTGGTGATTGGTGATTGGTGGSGGSTTPDGGSGGQTTGAGGTGGTDAGGTGGDGGSGGAVVDPDDPYGARSGSFSMLVLTRTGGFRHQGSINTGLELLQEIADEQGFEMVRADDEDAPPAGPRVPVNEAITPEGLAPFEIVFHLNTTGDLLNNEQQAVYEEWMTGSNGAYVGVHSATDTENGWAFYSEVTGQYYDRHGPQNASGLLQLEDAADTFVATRHLPNPWPRNEEWYRFNSYQVWQVKPGFTILGRKQNADEFNGEPCMWTREWGNFRAFYTCLGHANVVFDNDPQIKQLITGAIMWAVRREHLMVE